MFVLPSVPFEVPLVRSVVANVTFAPTAPIPEGTLFRNARWMTTYAWASQICRRPLVENRIREKMTIIDLIKRRGVKTRPVAFNQMIAALGDAADRQNQFSADAVKVVDVILNDSFSVETVIKVADFLDIHTENVPALHSLLNELDDQLERRRLKQ